ALGGRRRPDVSGFIGLPHCQRATIGVRVHGDRFYFHFPQGSDDADRDFSPIGDENFTEHRSAIVAGRSLIPFVGGNTGSPTSVGRRRTAADSEGKAPAHAAATASELGRVTRSRPGLPRVWLHGRIGTKLRSSCDLLRTRGAAKRAGHSSRAARR